MRNRSFVQLALVDEGRKSVILDIAGYPPGERVKNQIGVREALPKQYGDAPEYTLARISHRENRKGNFSRFFAAALGQSRS